MANEKSKPKSKENTIKSAPKSADRTVKNTPKTIKEANAVSDVKTLAKTAAVKQAMELKHTAEKPAEQSERPENYAVDTVEERGTAAVSAVKNTASNAARKYAVKKYEQHRAKRNIKDAEPVPGQSPNDNSVPRLSENNQPKTRDIAVKSPKGEQVCTKSDIKVKTKEYYIQKEQTEIKSVKSANVSDKKVNVKTKENYIKQHTLVPDQKAAPKRSYQLSKRKIGNKNIHQPINPAPPNEPKTAEQARKEYVVNKLKTKSAADKQAAQNISDIKSPTPKTELSVKPVEAPAKAPANKFSVKTKENYINSIRTKPVEIVKTPYSRAPKQNTHTITRSVQNSSKAVRTKEQVTSKTVKSGRNVFKASRTAKQKTAKTARKAVKTQKQAAKAAKAAAKQAKIVAQKTAQAAKAAAKATAKIAVKVAQAVVAATKALISAIAAGGPIAVLIVVLIVIIIIAAIVASPFGITISEEVTDAGTIPLSQIIAEYNVELTQETENIELSVTHNTVEVVDNRTDNNIVIAVFAAKLAGAEDDTAEDVVVFDDVKAEKLKDFFRAANTVSYTTAETTVGEGETATTQIALTITVTGKTKDELMDEYSLTAHQREAVEMLLANGDILTSTSHSLAITDADVQSIINGLPASLPQKRKDVVKNAGSLVGKVNYFWGGKSSAIGWDSAWGTMQRVTAAGSPSSGTIRAYGLDCSGYVTWAFNNSGMYPGDGTIGQRDRSVVVSASAVQAGDLYFLPSYSHVGIVVGKDASGNILVFHCSSSANNVVLATASSVGFTVFRRPNCY